MNKEYFEATLENTKIAKEQWEMFAKDCDNINDFRKDFHLRPTSSGVTIVSSLKEKPMRGIKVGKTVVKKKLGEIYEIIKLQEKLELLTQMKFQDRINTSAHKKEEDYQAEMISKMMDNESLKKALNVEKLIFITSEFILHDSGDKSEKNRIDIIAYDGANRLFFFELKEPNNTKDDGYSQVKRYLKVYGEGEKKKQMLEILANYPGCSIKLDNLKIEGYVIVGYSKKIIENSEIGIIKFEDGVKN